MIALENLTKKMSPNHCGIGVWRPYVVQEILEEVNEVGTRHVSGGG